MNDERPRYTATNWSLAGSDAGWTRSRGVRGRELAVAWGEFLGRVPWEVFVTLTFDPRRVFPVSCDDATREACRWCGEVAYINRRTIGWIVAAERGHGGQWHAHVLIVGASKRDVAVPAAVWKVRNGHAEVLDVQSVTGVAMYTSKDIARGAELVLSDTLVRYRHHLAPDVVVDLYPHADGTAGAVTA